MPVGMRTIISIACRGVTIGGGIVGTTTIGGTGFAGGVVGTTTVGGAGFAGGVVGTTTIGGAGMVGGVVGTTTVGGAGMVGGVVGMLAVPPPPPPQAVSMTEVANSRARSPLSFSLLVFIMVNDDFIRNLLQFDRLLARLICGVCKHLTDSVTVAHNSLRIDNGKLRSNLVRLSCESRNPVKPPNPQGLSTCNTT